MTEVRRDGLPAENGLDHLVYTSRTLGLSESAAMTAAIGRLGASQKAARRAAANAPSNWEIAPNEAMDRQYRGELERLHEEDEAIRRHLERMTEAHWAEGS